MRKFLDECKQKGWKLFGSSECEGFDPFGGGCPGHEIIEDEIEKTELPIDAEQPTPSPQMLLFQ